VIEGRFRSREGPQKQKRVGNNLIVLMLLIFEIASYIRGFGVLG
jgi:hypothetical protein